MAALALAPATFLDRALLAQLAVLAVAYIPGRVVGLTPCVETVTLGVRRFVAPVLLAAVVAVPGGRGRAAGRRQRGQPCRRSGTR